MNHPKIVPAFLLFGALSLSARDGHATDFYVDPATGDMKNDGSAAKPWSTLEAVLASNLIETQDWAKLPYAPGAALVAKNPGAPVKAGDTIYLRDGYHGVADIASAYNVSDITIAAASGAKPKLGWVSVKASQHWRLVGLSVSPSYAAAYDASHDLISLLDDGYLGPASYVTIDSCFLESVPDTSAWTANDWLTLPASGLSVGGSHHTIVGNHLHNVRFALSVTASDTLVDHNVIDSFGNGDGMRGLGDNSTFQYNIVKNAHHPDPVASHGNHDDGFQSWSLGVDPSDGKIKPGFGVVKGIVLRGNIVIAYEDDNQPFASDMQGLSGFDGMFQGFVIENNVVVTNAYHGISWYGCIDCRIVNNTVMDRSATKAGSPWIMIHDHKNGTPSAGNVVRNNLSAKLNIQSTGVVQDHNVIIDNPLALFIAPKTFDLHLLPTAAVAIDTGSSDQAPADDLDGVPRPQGAGFDLGAYEYHQGSLGGGAGAGTGGAGGGAGSSGGVGAGAAGGSGGGAGGVGGSEPGGTSGNAGTAGGLGEGAGGGSGGGAAGSGQGGTSGGSKGGQAGKGGVNSTGGAGGAISEGGRSAAGARATDAGGAMAGTASATPMDAGSPDSKGGCGCETTGHRPYRFEALAIALAAAGAGKRRRARVRGRGQ